MLAAQKDTLALMKAVPMAELTAPQKAVSMVGSMADYSAYPTADLSD